MSLAMLAAIVVGLGVPTPPAPCWSPPVSGAVSRGFEGPACPWCPGHRGVRYATAPGQVVSAVAAGRVSFSGAVVGQVWVTVETVDRFRVTVGPLAARTVSSGQRVTAGEPIGEAVHWLMVTVRDPVSGQYVDPAPLLSRPRRTPRLVPENGRPPGPRPIPNRAACASNGGGPAASR